jgi:O-antigen/teichoic acid export membrane protein
MRELSGTAAGGTNATIAKNAFHLVLGQVATTALAIVFNASLGRSLGARDFGCYFLIGSFATFAYVLVDWGQQFYLIREIARTPALGGPLLGSALVMRALGAVLISVPAGLTALALGYDARTSCLLVAFIAVNLPFFLAQSYGLVFRGRDRMGLDATLSVVNRAVGLALAVIALRLRTGLWGVIIGQGIAGGVALVVATRLYDRVGVGRLAFSKTTARDLFVGGGALVTMMIASSVQPYIDAVVLSKAAPADVVGWYGAARSIMGSLMAPAMILGAAAFPRLSRAAHDQTQFATEVRAVLRPILWLGGLASVGTYAFADTAVALVYGQGQFAPAGTIMKVFAPGFFLLFIDILLGNALTAMGRATAFSLGKVVSVVVSTALDLVLVPMLQRRTGNGGIGLVTAFLASEFCVLLGALYFMPKGSLGSRALVDLTRALASAGVTALLLHSLPALPLYAGIPICVLVFTASSIAFGLVRSGDRHTFLQFLGTRRGAPIAPTAPELNVPSRGIS